MRTSFTLALALTTSVNACASDQNKKLEDAYAQEADYQRMSAVQSAETARKAEVGAFEDRQKYVTDAQTRLHRIKARLDETKQNALLAPERVPLSTKQKIDEANRGSTAIDDEIRRLPQVTPQRWPDETKRIDGRLDHIDKLVSDASSEVMSTRP